MPISVRPISYDSDGQALVDVLQANLPYRSHARFFSWLYRANPEGPAMVWLAIDSGSGRIAGVASAFPRRLYVAGDEVRGYVLGDFCIAPECRSLGVAVMLQRACLEGVSASGAGGAYDLPSQAMLAVYKRLRIESDASMVRHAKPLRVDRQVAQRVPIPAFAQGLSKLANTGLRWGQAASAKVLRGITVEAGPWGKEFTEAARNAAAPGDVRVARTAAYLNWRYGEHPQSSYEMLTARHGADLRGYLVQHMNGENCTIDDLVAAQDATGGALLAKATALARERGVHTLSAPWLSTHPGRRLLESSGFRPRESQPVVLLNFLLPSEGAAHAWHLTNGDWDN